MPNISKLTDLFAALDLMQAVRRVDSLPVMDVPLHQRGALDELVALEWAEVVYVGPGGFHGAVCLTSAGNEALNAAQADAVEVLEYRSTWRKL